MNKEGQLHTMTAVVSFKDVLEALESADDGSVHFLNPDTGEVLMIIEEERRMVEDEDKDSWEDLPKWQQDHMPKVREFLLNPRTLKLPGKFEIHEWQIMRDFAEEQEDDQIRRELLNSMHGSGAFRHFKSTIYRLGIENNWYKFCQEALEEIARDWLEEHKLAYK